MIRKDIQGLRAIAVVAVLLFHFWPEHLTGGYIGVDVFFVISGFLITSHLIRKPPVNRKTLFDFWARRIKRLIPAATLVLFVTIVASALWLPATMLQNTMYEAAAAAVYGVNWLFAINATDYLAAANATSPIQHYWSLSIEEQYYAVWPLIVGLAFLLGRRVYSSKKVLAAVLALIFTASLAYSIYYTEANPAAAYFVTTTRIWELTLGGIVALVVLKFTLPDRVAAPAAWLGLAAIATAAITYTKETAFPGYTALLPTLGTALVIWAYSDNLKWSPRWLLSLKPAQFIGDISYSVYLWHWPVIVIAPFALSAEYLTFAQKLPFIILIIILSYLTKVLVEDPVRNSSALLNTNLRTYAYGMASILVVVGVSFATAAINQSEVALAEKTLESAFSENDRCLGAGAMRNDECGDIAGPKLLTSPTYAKQDKSILYEAGCVSRIPFDTKMSCTYGDKNGQISIAMIGNSHTNHFFGPLEEIATANNWRLDTYIVSSCYPVQDKLRFDVSGASEKCHDWGEWALEAIIKNDYSAVIMSSSSANDIIGVSQDNQLVAKTKAYGKTLDLFTKSNIKTLVIRDVPNGGKNAPDCVSRYDDFTKCNNPRDVAESRDPLYEAAIERRSDKILPIDINDRFCDDSTCYVVIGGIIVYFDGGHISDSFARTLVPDIKPALQDLVNQ